MSWHRRSSRDSLVGAWLLAGLLARLAVYRRAEVCISSRRRWAAERRLLLLGVAKNFCHVSVDVCAPQAGIYHWRGRRTEQNCFRGRVCWRLDCCPLFFSGPPCL